MRINICGFYGFGNMGDESVLQAIVDELGIENDYIISTSLPYDRERWNNYKAILNRQGIRVYDIRTAEDIRTDFDAYILGGGELNWGFGWRQGMAIFADKLDKLDRNGGKNIKCMNYAVAYNKRWYYSEWLHNFYYEFLKNFDVITVRDLHSERLLDRVGINSKLTFDPSILLKEEKFDIGSGVGKIVVFPRYEDDAVSNDPQLDWLIRELACVAKDVVLVSCAPRSIEGVDVDAELCKYLHGRLNGSQILDISAFEPRKVKYLISMSKLVVSGGRYHPIVWAIGYGIPFKISSTAHSYSKISYLEDMYKKFGRDGLIELANKNREMFISMMAR